MSDEYKYTIDELQTLRRGCDLRFAYSGAGVATLIDRQGNGAKVAVGTFNLKAIDGDELVLEDDIEPTVPLEDLRKAELVKLAESMDLVADGLTRAQIIAAIEAKNAEGVKNDPDRSDGESTLGAGESGD